MPLHPLGNLKVPEDASFREMPNPTPIRGNTYKPWRGPVFTKIPSFADVKQGNLGNCYLVATLQAILARIDGPELIQSVIKDEGIAVVMRLFDTKDNKWQFVRLEKSLPSTFFRDRDHSVGEKWVQMFEKAYAGFAKNGTYAAMAAGGDSLASLPVFTGGVTNFRQAGEPPLTAMRLLTENVNIENSGLTEDKKVKLLALLEREIKLTPAEVVIWYRWRDARKLKFTACYNAPYLQTFDDIVERGSGHPHPLDAAVKGKVLDWYEKATPIPGLMGSGVYTQGQLNFFMRVQRNVATQRPVTVESKNKGLWPVIPNAKKKGTGEATYEGLASDHAYSVVDAKVEANLRYLLIRNPWGNYQRVYKAQPGGTLTPRAGKSNTGDSWIELSDFFMYFHDQMAEGAAVHSVARNAHMGALESNLQRAIEFRTMRNWGRGL